MTANELRLNILGTSFTISADEDQSYLDEIFSQYREAVENTQSISGISDPLKTAILTGFLLCDEIHKMRLRSGEAEKLRQGEEREAEDRALNLIARIDQVLENKIQKTNE
jgi:cell division protein ZapA (FtsZ GTPase activity inhibitor)